MVLIAPSLLSADFGDIRLEIKRTAAAGADWIHWDIMDGHFVPNLTIGPDVVKSVRPDSRLVFDVHLMLTNPLDYCPAFIDAGADYITFHIESNNNPRNVIKLIKKRGLKVGISLNPDTPVKAIEPYLGLVDLVLVMTVHPGYGGQKYITAAARKITELRGRKAAGSYRYLIEVDGGINDRTCVDAIARGADVLVAGSYVYRHRDLRRPIRLLKSVGAQPSPPKKSKK